MMVDVSRIKGRLGSPPGSQEVKGNLKEPEERVVIADGRSLRTTGRTAQLSTRVRPETLNLLRQMAARDGITMAEVIERALDLYAGKQLDSG